MLIEKYKFIAKALLISLLLFFFTRVGFYFTNMDYFAKSQLSELVFALFYGLRFDVATVFMVNLPFILLGFLPLSHSLIQSIRKLSFILMNIFFLGINIIDWEFFSFIGKKMTADIFDIGGDIQAQTGQIIYNYWPYSLVIIFVFGSLIKFYPNEEKSEVSFHVKGLIKSSFIHFLFLVFCFISVRGGLQLRSISPKQAFIFENFELGNLSLNPSYTVLRSFGKKSLKPLIKESIK